MTSTKIALYVLGISIALGAAYFWRVALYEECRTLHQGSALYCLSR